MKRFLAIMLSVCAVAAFSAGCGGGNSDGGNGGGGTGATTAAGDSNSGSGNSGNGGAAATANTKSELVVAVASEPVHFTTFYDTTSGDVDHIVLLNIYDTLLYKDVTDGSVKPWLAEKWEVAADGLSISFKLREGVKFHNGTPLTSKDVKFTYDSAKAKPIGSSLLINYKETEVVDDYNFIIHMTAPFEPILNAFCSRASTVMSEDYFNEVGGIEGYKAKPVGTGAYKFVSMTSGDSIIMEKNADWWGGDVAYEKITIKTISDINTQILSLESGGVDVVIGAPLENLNFLSGNNVTWDAAGSNATEFMSFNVNDTRPVASDMNFRKAVQAGIDKDAINMAVFGGKAVLVDIFGSPAFTTRPQAGTYAGYSFDPAKAKEYLAASNYNGEEFNVVCQAGTPEHKSLEVIQGSLQEIGINMKVTAVDAPTFFDTVNNTGDFDAQIVINTSSILDMDSLYNYFSETKQTENKQNYPRGPRMAELATNQRTNPDSAKRLADITELVNIVNEDAYTVYTLVNINTIAYNKDVQGVSANMAKYYRFAEWK